MCGINAIYDPQRRLENKPGHIQAMGAAMHYRGPDDEGAFANEVVALGSRRLSIIDVDGGRQPLFNETGELAIVCNGEIYNYVELMADLRERGHQFRTASDVEVILHLYEERGVDCLHELRGMFAFVIWDARRQRLFAARDRVGLKPLYMAQHDDVLWLSSELKTIVGAAGIAPTLRSEAVYQFLLYSYAIDQRHTIVEQVERVLPGEYLLADERGIRLTRYWTPRLGGLQGIADRSDAAILATLEQAVQLHLRSDVQVGILLSGGIDSSAIAALAAQAGGSYTALCAGYPGDDPNDERAQAHATAEVLGLPVVDVMLDAAAYERDFAELARHCDEPVGDLAAAPQWSLYRAAQQLGYKVLLSGIGGDELAFGYGRWNEIGAQSAALSEGDYAGWIGFDQSPDQAHARQALDSLAGPALREVATEANRPLYELRDLGQPGPDAMAAMLFGSYLLHNGCALTDKLSMGCSIELRVPLLDHVLVETVFGLPLERRFEPGQTKALLRRVLRGVVPDAVLAAPKLGFTPPGSYADALVTGRIEQIRSGHLAQSGLVDKARLEAMCARHASAPWLRTQRVRNLIGIPKSITILFRMLALECWFETLQSASTHAGAQQ
jgi:asparagine synthase (glutamine-hydrolysing)